MHKFPKSNGMLPIQTPKFNGDGITMLVMSRHEDVIGNVVLAIQNQRVTPSGFGADYWTLVQPSDSRVSSLWISTYIYILHKTL